MGLNEETKYEITNFYYCFVNSLIRFIRLAAICDYRSLNERAVVLRGNVVFFEKKLGEGLIFWGIVTNFVVGLVMEAKSMFHYRRFLYEYQQFGVNCRHL